MHDAGSVPPPAAGHRHARGPVRARRLAAVLGLLAAASLVVAACAEGAPAPSGPLVPGTSSAPRDVVIQMYDYRYVPAEVDLVPGETVNLQVINGGLGGSAALMTEYGSLDEGLHQPSPDSSTPQSLGLGPSVG